MSSTRDKKDAASDITSAAPHAAPHAGDEYVRPFTVACRWCKAPTLDVVNRQCLRCLQLSCRIARDTELARHMLIEIIDALRKQEQRQRH